MLRPATRRFPPLGLLALALVAGGCVERLDVPEAPDTTGLVESVAEPTGRVSATPFVDVLGAVAAGDVIQKLCGFDPMAEAECGLTDSCPDCAIAQALMEGVMALLSSFDEAAEDGDVDGIAGVTGFVDVERICPGFGAPQPLPSNGQVDLTIGFTGRGLDPVIYGGATDCQTTLSGVDSVIDGEFLMVYEERVPFSNVPSTPLLMGFNGTVDQGGERLDVSFALSFRPDGVGRRAFLIEVPGEGTFLFVLSPIGLQLEGADGAFVCDIVTMDCQAVTP